MSIALTPAFAIALALLAAGLLLWVDRRGEHAVYAMLPLAVLASLGWIAWWGPRAPLAAAPLATCLVIALLARAREDQLHTEVAMKLLWVMGVAFALAWSGTVLLAASTGTPRQIEQWGVLGMELDSPMLWSTSLSLALIAGVVLLGGAPFHFWSADLLQGSRAWLGPIAVVTLQVCGATWIERRIAGIENFAPAANVVNVMLAIAAGTAFIVGGFTLRWQRRPERLTGTLVSLHGGLALASICAGHSPGRPVPPADLGPWCAHLMLATIGAATLARLTPVEDQPGAPPAVLFLRHPVAAISGLFALASLAGVPGTPGAAIWLDIARRTIDSGHVWVLCALGFGWISAFAYAIAQVRIAFGAPATTPRPERKVPRPVRGALWVSGLGLAVMGVARLLDGVVFVP